MGDVELSEIEKETSRRMDLPIEDRRKTVPDTADVEVTRILAESSERAATDQRQTAEGAPSIPGYELLGEIGRGGMGVVYKARHRGLNRLVALKVMQGRGPADIGETQRFRAEALALAQVRHPNVVAVHDFGTVGDRPYLALELIEGGTLADRLKGEPQPPRLVAHLLIQLADGVQAIHEQGIVHRDLKPANILLQSGDCGLRSAQSQTEDRAATSAVSQSASRTRPAVIPKIADFGLSRRLDGAMGLTLPGSVLGTPAYMAPEQASGHADQIAQATDVYALGVILYELLIGRVPLRGASVAATLDLVRWQEPVPPRRLQPGVPADLETICLKCLHKESEKRYGSARALADDLRRFLDGRPILARPVGILERTWRWCRRHRALTALYAVTTAAALALLGLGLWFSERLGAERGERKAANAAAEAARQVAEAEKFFGLRSKARVQVAEHEPGWTWTTLADLEEAARLPAARDRLAELRSLAAASLAGIDVRRALTIKYYARSIAYHPDGKRLAMGQFKASGYLFCAVRLIDLDRPDRHEELSFPAVPVLEPGPGLCQDGVCSLVFSRDGRWLAAGTRSGRLHRWDLTCQPPALHSWIAHAREVKHLAFGLDGTILSAGRTTLRRWDIVTGKELAAPFRAGDGIESLAVHPLDGWVLCGGDGGLYTLSPSTLRPTRPTLPIPTYCVRFLPGGSYWVAVKDRSLRLGDSARGQVLFSLEAPGIEEGGLSDLAVSADGSLLLASSSWSKHAQLWETSSGRLLADLPIGDGDCRVAFHPNGRSFVVAAGPRTLLYQIGGRRQQTFLGAGAETIKGLAPSPDGRSLACVTASGVVEVWRLDGPVPASPSARHTITPFDRGADCSVAFSPLRPYLAWTQPKHGLLGLWNLSTDHAAPLVVSPAAETLAFSPDGRLWGTFDDEVRAWDVPGGKQTVRWSNRLAEALAGLSGVRAVAPGRTWVAAGCRDGRVRILQAVDGTAHSSTRIADNPVHCVALSADDSVVAAGSERGELSVLRVADGDVLARQPAHADRVEAIAFSGNRLLASGSRAGKVILWHWNGVALDPLMTLPTPGSVRSLAFHPDGMRLFVLLDRERSVRVWHLDRLCERLTQLGLGAGLEDVLTPVRPGL
jgi:serine/threonine protein kinase/WD40 repeat protein